MSNRKRPTVTSDQVEIEEKKQEQVEEVAHAEGQMTLRRITQDESTYYPPIGIQVERQMTNTFPDGSTRVHTSFKTYDLWADKDLVVPVEVGEKFLAAYPNDVREVRA